MRIVLIEIDKRILDEKRAILAHALIQQKIKLIANSEESIHHQKISLYNQLLVVYQVITQIKKNIETIKAIHQQTVNLYAKALENKLTHYLSLSHINLNEGTTKAQRIAFFKEYIDADHHLNKQIGCEINPERLSFLKQAKEQLLITLAKRHHFHSLLNANQAEQQKLYHYLKPTMEKAQQKLHECVQLKKNLKIEKGTLQLESQSIKLQYQVLQNQNIAITQKIKGLESKPLTKEKIENIDADFNHLMNSFEKPLQHDFQLR